MLMEQRAAWAPLSMGLSISMLKTPCLVSKHTVASPSPPRFYAFVCLARTKQKDTIHDANRNGTATANGKRSEHFSAIELHNINIF